MQMLKNIWINITKYIFLLYYLYLETEYMLLCIVCLEHLNNIETTPLFIPFLSGSSLKSLIYRETTFVLKELC